MGKLFKWAKPFIGLLITISLIEIFLPITYSFVPQFTKYVFDYILGDAIASNTLPKFLLNFFESLRNSNIALCVICVCVILVFYQIVRASIMFLNGYLRGKFAEGIAYNIRNEMFIHFQDLPFSKYNEIDSGDFIQRSTSDIETVKSFISNQLPEIAYIIASSLASAIQMSKINVGIMLVTLTIVPLILVSSLIYFKFITKQFDKVEKDESNMTQCIEENVHGTRVVKAFAKEKEEIEKFNDKNTKYRDQCQKINRAMGIFWGLSDGIISLQYAATIAYCLYLAEQGLVGVGDIVVCLSYIGMLIYPIRGLGRIIADFGKSKVAAGRIDEIINYENEYVNDGLLSPEVKGNIIFDNVSFQFKDATYPLLKGVSFDIKQGETVAIVGKTGCGKSTIVHILERLIDYDSGSITIDGVELKDISKKCIRQNIGLVLQDPFLYNKTIYENVKIASPNSKEADVYKATSNAFIHKDILNFDKKYETLVGEKGATLSGGQKQRIAIARTLILGKPIVIFDDSLSAVDTATDKAIRDAIKKETKDLTTIIITHRITTAKEADKIIVLDNGVVSDIGTHNELASKEGLYASLWKIQGALEEEFSNLVLKEAE